MNEDRIIQKLIEMDEKIDGLTTQTYVDARFNDVMTILDVHTRMLENLDHERLAGLERMKRIETDVQQSKSHPNLV